MRYWLGLLILELFTGAMAGFIFQVLERNQAGYVAGSFFFAVGVLALCISWRKSAHLRWLNIFISAVYLFGFSGPLFFTRLFTGYSQPVISVIGIPMGDFHSYSVTAYKALLVMTVVQIFLIKWGHKFKKSRDPIL